MVLLKEVEIKHCFGLKHVTLNFETNNYATIFSSSSSLKGNLNYAVKSFFCDDTLQCKEGCTPDCRHGSSLVRIKFFCKIRNGNRIVVDAARLFPPSNAVLYYFDNQQYIDAVEVFRERCHLDILFYDDLSLDIHSTVMKNCNSVVHNKSLSDLLADYLSASNRWQTSKHQQITKYMQISALIDKELELSKKRVFVDVINEIGEIFKYITWEEYGVKFIIPLVDKILNVQDMNWDYMNLSKTETWVTKIGSNSSCILNELEPGLKEIVKISQSIALAKHLEKKCIFIEDMTIIEKYQNQEMIKEAIARSIHTDSEAALESSTKKNFMWRIIDICNRFELSIFINCRGRLPALPAEVNLVQCNSANSNDDELINIRIE